MDLEQLHRRAIAVGEIRKNQKVIEQDNERVAKEAQTIEASLRASGQLPQEALPTQDESVEAQLSLGAIMQRRAIRAANLSPNFKNYAKGLLKQCVNMAEAILSANGSEVLGDVCLAAEQTLGPSPEPIQVLITGRTIDMGEYRVSLVKSEELDEGGNVVQRDYAEPPGTDEADVREHAVYTLYIDRPETEWRPDTIYYEEVMNDGVSGTYTGDSVRLFTASDSWVDSSNVAQFKDSAQTLEELAKHCGIAV